MTRSGYTRVEQETGGAYWTVGSELNLDSPVGRLGIGMMNHAAILDDAVVFAQQEPDIRQVTQAAAGLAPSMLEQQIWSGMLSLFPADTVAMIPLVPGARAAGASVATPVASPAGDGEGIRYLAFGVRAGSFSAPIALGGEGAATPASTPGDAGIPARVEARIRYRSADVAQREADAIGDRWMEALSPFDGQPYRELMTIGSITVSDADPTVVAIAFTSPVPNRWVQMIQMSDLAPLIPTAARGVSGRDARGAVWRPRWPSGR